MSTLADAKIKEIAMFAAKANLGRFEDVTIAPALDSTGSEAIEITIFLTNGSTASIMGERSAKTVAQVIRELADEGEERSPIIRYREKGATSSS